MIGRDAGTEALVRFHDLSGAIRNCYRKLAINYWSFPYSASACFRMGISGSASFQSVRKSSYATRALLVPLEDVGTHEAKMRERSELAVPHQSAVVEVFLKLACSRWSFA